jgi:hypothetical protein
MDRIEPQHEPDSRTLIFRSPPRWTEPVADNRFALGAAIFLLVALAYPWYSYWVQTHLLASDVEAGLEDFGKAMQQETAAASAQSASDAQGARERAEQQRVGAVRVIGISEGSPPLVVVDLGQSNLLEADITVCRQAARWLHRSTSGQVIRVQRAHVYGNANAIQELACP